MPMYKATRIQNGHITGRAEFEATDDAMAWNEANEEIDVLKGEWVEVKKMTSSQEASNE